MRRVRLTAGTAVARICPVAVLAALAACGATPYPVARPSTAPPPQRFVDVTAADFTSAVKVLSFDAVAKSAVVEPVVFMTGPAYCSSFGVSPADERCSREYLVEDSHIKVALPLAASVSLRITRNGDDRCIGTMAGGGTCRATATAFAAAVAESGELLARVTVHGGEITVLAQLYTP